jgi:hypothetical protein
MARSRAIAPRTLLTGAVGVGTLLASMKATPQTTSHAAAAPVVAAPRRPLWVLVALGLIVAVGAYLRLSQLGARGIPGDELELWRFCSSGASGWEILSGKIEHPMDKVLPAYIQGFRNIFGLPLTAFTLRLPGALLGILCIPLLYLCGVHLFGRGGGLVAAALFALSPVQIQCAREAYPYILSSAGFVVGLWCVLHALARVQAGRSPAAGSYAAFLVAMLLMMYASMAAWPFAGLLGLAFLGVGGLALRGGPRRRWGVAAVGVAVMLVTVGPRAWVYLAGSLARGSGKYAEAKAQVGGVPLVDWHGLRFIYNFAWGSSGVRLALLAVVLGLVAVALWRRRRQWNFGLLVALVPLCFVATMVSRYVTGNPFWSRFLVPMLPAYVLVLTAGVLLPLELLASRPRLRTVLGAVWLGLVLAPLAGPAMLAARMEGTPFPYRQIVAWADARFPPGTPVVCDRFFDAYNEFLVNPSTSVVFTATVPNEPFERFEQVRWRDTAVEFFRNNPDAAMYEAHMFWQRVGRWEWPYRHFARHESFLDARYAELEKLGLTYRDIGRDYTLESLARVIHYNTPDDLIAKARTEGLPALALYGPGWAYTKTQDYRDWRVLRDQAAVTIHALTPGTNTTVFLRVFGVAVQGDKTVRGPAGSVVFRENQPVRAELGPVVLEPGPNTITLSDLQWSSRQAPLLVQRIEAVAADAASP